jgi:hypothetical protein
MNQAPINVLITGVGGPTPRSFARALKDFGLHRDRYRLFATDIHPYAVGLYQHHLFERAFVTPRSSQAGYWEAMQKIIADHAIDVAVILPETEAYVWSQRQQTGDLPCRALIPDQAMVEAVLDKSVLTEALAPHGLVPNSVAIRSLDESTKSLIDNTLRYPFWVRSATGSSGLGSFKVHTYDDLVRWMSINQGVETFLASDFLAGRNLACKFLYHEGRLLRAACGERVNYIMAKVSPSGITGNTSFGRLLNDPAVFEVAKRAIDLIFEESGAKKHGFFTVDLKEDHDGRPFVTEINVRHVAFTAAFAAAGANLCEDTVRVLMDDPTFDPTFMLYEFEEGTIFLRDVDAAPIVMLEKDLLPQ